jgi:kynurenine formamidase
VRIHDLTRSLVTGMPVYSGDPPVEITGWAALERDGYRVSRLIMGSHAGTHLDAPAHFIPGGAGVERIPLEVLVGPARVVSAAEVGAVGPGERLLIRSGWSQRWGEADYFESFPALPAGLAARLAAAPAALVGLETPSLHQDHEEDARLHRLLLGAGTVIVENLVGLDRLPERVFLAALPLPLAGVDGSPCRVVAIEESEPML